MVLRGNKLKNFFLTFLVLICAKSSLASLKTEFSRMELDSQKFSLLARATESPKNEDLLGELIASYPDLHFIILAELLEFSSSEEAGEEISWLDPKVDLLTNEWYARTCSKTLPETVAGFFLAPFSKIEGIPREYLEDSHIIVIKKNAVRHQIIHEVLHYLLHLAREKKYEGNVITESNVHIQLTDKMNLLGENVNEHIAKKTLGTIEGLTTMANFMLAQLQWLEFGAAEEIDLISILLQNRDLLRISNSEAQAQLLYMNLSFQKLEPKIEKLFANIKHLISFRSTVPDKGAENLDALINRLFEQAKLYEMAYQTQVSRYQSFQGTSFSLRK